MTSDTPIFLIGFMASGKSTLGRALAAAMSGRTFVDIDEAVESQAGMSVADIFATCGEAAFRELETAALRAAAATPGAIVACGGGTPCHGANMDMMLAAGTVVWLQADDARTIERLRLVPHQRPLVEAVIDDDAALLALMHDMNNKRRPFYSRAHRCFDSSRLDDAAQIEESVQQFIKEIII